MTREAVSRSEHDYEITDSSENSDAGKSERSVGSDVAWLVEKIIVPLLVGLLPVAVTLASLRYTQTADADRSSRETQAEADRKQEKELAEKNRQNSIMSEYLKQMTEFLTKYNLGGGSPKPGAVSAARAITLNATRQLNSTGKGQVLRFLFDANLIGGNCEIDLKTGKPKDCKRATVPVGDIKFDEARIDSTVVFKLSGIDLQGVGLNGAELSKMNLSQARLDGANLQKTNLAEALLTEAQLDGTGLQNANLFGALLPKAKLSGADLSNADLTCANLRETQFITSGDEQFLQGKNLNEFSDKDRLTNAARANFKDAILIDAKLSGINLKGANLRGANLQGAKLYRANLRGVDFQGAVLEKAVYHVQNAENIAATCSAMATTYLEDENSDQFKAQRDLYLVDKKNGKKRGKLLKGADLEEADLTGADLRKTKLAGVNLKKANLEFADLRGADLQGADLSQANFEGAIYDVKTTFPPGFDKKKRGLRNLDWLDLKNIHNPDWRNLKGKPDKSNS